MNNTLNQFVQKVVCMELFLFKIMHYLQTNTILGYLNRLTEFSNQGLTKPLWVHGGIAGGLIVIEIQI